MLYLSFENSQTVVAKHLLKYLRKHNSYLPTKPTTLIGIQTSKGKSKKGKYKRTMAINGTKHKLLKTSDTTFFPVKTSTNADERWSVIKGLQWDQVTMPIYVSLQRFIRPSVCLYMSLSFCPSTRQWHNSI